MAIILSTEFTDSQAVISENTSQQSVVASSHWRKDPQLKMENNSIPSLFRLPRHFTSNHPSHHAPRSSSTYFPLHRSRNRASRGRTKDDGKVGQKSALTKFTCFSALPPELRDQIWEEALPPGFVCFESSFPVYLGAGMNKVSAVGQVNSEARLVAKRRRLIIQCWQGGFVRMDPERDTLKICGMDIPCVVASTAWPTAGVSRDALPVRKLQALLCMPITVPPHIFRIYIQGQMSQRLNLDPFPRLREWTMVGKYWPADLWLDSYQMFGPEVINQPDHDCLWDWTSGDGEYVERAAPYFEKKGFCGHAGMRWPKNERGSSHDYAYPLLARLRRDQETWRVEAHRRGPKILFGRSSGSKVSLAAYWDTFRPSIGLMGYSMGAVSCGGQWAGFLYYAETGKVFFTPLAWHEVKDDLESNKEPNGPYADVVMKFFIVYPGEEAPKADHYAWQEVKSFDPTDTRDMKIIRVMWRIAHGIFNHRVRIRNDYMRLEA